MPHTRTVRMSAWAVPGIPEIVSGNDLTVVIVAAVVSDSGDELSGGLQDGDILTVTSKIVSKAEGRSVQAADREQAITDETVRVVASRVNATGVTRIVENRLGLVMAAAGVDSSNTSDGTVLLLPLDPDATARQLCRALRERFGVRLGVVITDTVGRPWRMGQADIAIGAAGIRVLDDLRGTVDASGRPLAVSVTAVADEIAAATDLVKGKVGGLPVAVVRGLAHHVTELDAVGARSLVRIGADDMFHLGTKEAWLAGFDEANKRLARSHDTTFEED
ncbi:coenzyme F420-0:L-glutamate ligase/coenzyme F420-1:gamma-L-glutamate ligase [Rhodoglobus vestalii]|uniref:Coenzyme F420-0:L-glutamate ligase/coenzyme F420-1:gamma-L-glutamate ligase n=2 Tax=Rhodoglobus vestalii TaxID=193384 RepID=A0A8H2PUT5_9MICO|nr:coenzyme F420-0:L-glutamate ligase/coenzyme F420-1:gamma-L-glutamate ligase [Rhodoglobus vestalii]